MNEEILNIIKPVSVEGHKEISESAVELVVSNDTNCSQNERLEKHSESPKPCSSKQLPTPSTGAQTFLKRGSTCLRHASAATDKYGDYLEKKLDIKKSYYQEKLQIMRISAESQNRAAEALTNLAEIMRELI